MGLWVLTHRARISSVSVVKLPGRDRFLRTLDDSHTVRLDLQENKNQVCMYVTTQCLAF